MSGGGKTKLAAAAVPDINRAAVTMAATKHEASLDFIPELILPAKRG
jgi:hypothetical protein